MDSESPSQGVHISGMRVFDTQWPGAWGMKECLQSSTESPEANSAGVMKKFGVLSFGSAKNFGGGLTKGAQAQVQSPFSFPDIRAQLHKRKNRLRAHQQLYPSLMTKPAERVL